MRVVLMQIDNFNFMWRGKFVAPLEEKNAQLLLPVDIRQHDTGRALLLIHGFSSSPAVYRRFIPELVKYYDAVVCPALPGHANTIDAFAKVTASEWVSFVHKTAMDLAASYQTLDVMGLSLGGLLAYQLQAMMPINHLFLLAPALVLCGPTRLKLWLARVLSQLGLKSIPNHAGNFHIKGDAELTYRKLPVHAIIEILNFIQQYPFSRSQGAVDVFLGRYDEVVDSQAVAALFADCENTSIHWMDNSAHILPLDGDVDLILRRVREIAVESGPT